MRILRIAASLGRELVTASVTAVVVIAGLHLLAETPKTAASTDDQQIVWQHLDGGESGTSLQRVELPDGWLVEGADGYLITVKDDDKEWLPAPQQDERSNVLLPDQIIGALLMLTVVGWGSLFYAITEI